jgi:hypothetical protein
MTTRGPQAKHGDARSTRAATWRRAPALLLVLALAPGAQAQDAPPTPPLLEAAADEEDNDSPFLSDGPWYLVPTLRASPGAQIIDAIGAGRSVYALDDQGVLHASHDGGQSFAARDLVESSHGVWRPHLSDPVLPYLYSGLETAEHVNYLGGMGLYLVLSGRQHLRWNISDAFSFPYGTTGEPYLELSPDSPAFNGGIWIPGVPRPGAWNFADDVTDLNAGFGVSDRLHGQTGRGSRPAHVVTVDLNEPRRIAIAGKGGVIISRDGGLTYDVLRESPPFTCCDSAVFAGSTLIGTTGRVLTVRSEGIGDPLLPGAVVPEVEWAVRDKGDPEHLLFVAEQELLESFDGGRTVARVFMARASRINHVAVEPSSGKVFVATMTGMFVRGEAGAEFVDTGIAGPVHSVEVNPIDPSEVLITKFRAMERSTDGGRTFGQFVELDGAPVAVLDPVPGRGWMIVTERGAYRLSRTPPDAVDAGRVALARYLLRQQPTAPEAVALADEHFVHPPPARAYLDQLLPRVNVLLGVLYGPQRAFLNYVPLTGITTATTTDTRARDVIDQTVAPGINATIAREIGNIEPYGVIMLSWDLPELIGPPAPVYRERKAAEQRREVQDAVARLHALRARLFIERVLRPPSDPASVLDLEVRIEEMTDRLNALSGAGYTVPDFAQETDR